MITKKGSTKIVNFMSPRAGFLEHGRGHLSNVVKMHYFFKNLLLYSQANRQTKCIVTITKEGFTKIKNVMTPGVGVLVLRCGHISYIVKINYFYENLLYPGAWFRQTKCVVMMTREGSTNIVNIMTPEVGVLVLSCGHISYTVKLNYFYENLLYTQAQIRHAEGIVMISKEGSSKIVNFITPRVGILVQGRAK